MTSLQGWIVARLPLLLVLAAAPAVAPAQQEGPGWRLALGAGAIPLVTHAAPAMAGEARTEGYLTQPILTAGLRAPGGRLELSGMLNLEGATLQRGELNAGIWGEGYVDRRHPHTYLHELVATGWLAGSAASARGLSLSAGRGFAPFGTDDPMARPMVKFPANHHLAQVLERYVVQAAARVGPVALEAGMLNGNEPEGVSDLDGLGRFGDSWAARVSLAPSPGVELQGSHAMLAAPEFPAESELDHRKWSLSGRLERPIRGQGRGYLLAEWARTDEYAGAQRANTFHTLLVEGALGRRGVEFAGRLERTTRPEEERLVDPFRTPRPHSEVHLLGVTRWHIASARVAAGGVQEGPLRARPFVEVSHARVAAAVPNQVFDPEAFFGSTRLWSLSAGLRLAAGADHGRMGRYGAARTTAPGGVHQH